MQTKYRVGAGGNWVTTAHRRTINCTAVTDRQTDRQTQSRLTVNQSAAICEMYDRARSGLGATCNPPGGATEGFTSHRHNQLISETYLLPSQSLGSLLIKPNPTKRSQQKCTKFSLQRYREVEGKI